MPQTSQRGRSPLFIISVATGYGGAERNIEVLLPRMLPSRRIVIFAANRYHVESLRTLQRPDLEIHVVDATQDTFVGDVGRVFMRRYFALRPSAILANTLDSLRILAHVAAQLPGIDRQSVFCVHDFLWRDYETLLASVPRATLLAPDRCVLERPDYVGRAVQPRGPIRAVVLPNPVEVPPDEPESPAGNAPFLHLATVNGFKGHVHLADAAALLKQRDPSIRIDSFGHRPTLELFRDILRHLEAVGAAGTLALHDHVPDPSSLLRACRAVLVTSISDNGGSETFGRTIIEAWAFGRPVIAFATGAPARLIRHGIDGLLVDEKDTAGLAAAITRLHRDPALADRLGGAGRVRAMREFDADVLAAQLLAVLDGGWNLRPCGASTGRPASVPAVTRRRILFDVSLSLAMGWDRPAGLWRVEKDVADELAQRADADVVLVCRETGNTGFRHLTPAELERLANRQDGLAALAARALAPFEAPSRPAPQITGYLRSLGALELHVGRRGPVVDRLRRWLHRRAARAHAAVAEVPPPLQVGSEDVLICTSNPWDYLPADIFRQLRAQGVRLVLVVHDVMVWETPQWTAGRDPREYSDNMLSVITEAGRTIAISQATAATVGKALASAGKPVPPITVASPAGLRREAAPFGCPPPGFDGACSFVVYCSTIEVRKNHIMLLNLWDRLREQLPVERLPLLVFVGNWGWHVDAVRQTLQRNWRLSPHVRILEGIGDESLLWLYRHARFTLFPSFNEGFGLPVAESLAVGTPVLVSDHPALVEASEGLMPALDPYDLPAWQREVTRLCLDEAYLATLRQRAGRYRGAKPHDLPRAVAAAAGLA